MNTPPVKIRDIKNLYDLEGVLISVSNTRLNCEPEKCKKVFIGHGTGDKTYGGDPTILESYDYHFITGPKHLEKILDVAVKIPNEKLIKIGNLRFDEYINREIDREKYLDHLGVIDRNRKTILYAPTWRWGKGTLKIYGETFCEELTKEYNLIIRPHFHDRNNITRLRLWAKTKGLSHLYFSNPADVLHHDTMSDFAISDLLISDTSSILYEYLITCNPIIIAHTDYNNLHQMPPSMDIRNVADVYDGTTGTDIVKMIHKNLADQKRRNDYQELLHHCFYFNDGQSTNRAVEFLKTIES